MQKTSQITESTPEPQEPQDPATPHACHVDNVFESTVCLQRPTKNVDFSFFKLEPKFVIASHEPTSGVTITHIDTSDEELSELVKLFTHPDVLRLIPKETLAELVKRFSHPDVLKLIA